MSGLSRRVGKLEHDVSAGPVLYLWPNFGETVEQAKARQFPEGIPENATLYILRFAEDRDAQ